MVMKARSSAVLLAGVMSGVTLSLLCVTGALLWESRSLQRQLGMALSEANELRGQQTAAQTELASQRNQLATLTAEVRRLQDDSTADEEAPSPAIPNATRAGIYVGNRMVGLGWVVTSGTDGTGQGAGGGALSRVVLDPPAYPTATGENTATPGASGSASPAAGYAYQYQTSTYSWGYPWLYTYGWVDWPGCTNPPLEAFPSAPGVTPPTETVPAAVSPAPVVASKPYAAPQPWRPRLPQLASYPAVPRTVGVNPQRTMTPALATTATPRVGMQPAASRLATARPGVPGVGRAQPVPRR